MGPRIVVHADDVGMSHGANAAFVELSALGTISAGSVMVPCPWFAEIAGVAAADPSLDLGVHLTLTAEQAGYRWRPVSGPDPGAGLTDPSGHFWSRVADVRRHADPDAVEREWRAQVDTALEAGIDVTHLDAHMGAALAPEWSERYVALGAEYEVPVLVSSSLGVYGPNKHLADVSELEFGPVVTAAAAAGMPVFDRVLETDFSRPRDVPADYESLLAEADDDALVYCAFHPCRPGEIGVIEPDAHHVRVDEYELFRTDAWASWLRARDHEVIGMRALRDEWRRSTGAAAGDGA